MESAEDRAAFRRTLETTIRLAIIALLILYCFQVIRPFVQPIVSGAILAIALHPIHAMLRRGMGGRAGLAAGALVLIALLLVTVPSVLIAANLVESSAVIAGQLEDGTLRVPPPPATVADWPLVGTPVHALWSTASENLEAAVQQARPAVRVVASWLIAAGAATGMGILIFALSIGVAGAFLAFGDRVGEAAYGVARRLVPGQGDDLVDLSRDTVASVTRGILGVALIQATLSGIGLLVAGVPAAGLWALLILLMAVVQLPTVLLLAPLVVYVFAHQSTPIAVAFAIWALGITLSDNILKPLLLGRGARVPTLVIFMGAIGGFILEGIIGLFVGAVALAVGFTLFQEWLGQTQTEGVEATATERSTASAG